MGKALLEQILKLLTLKELFVGALKLSIEYKKVVKVEVDETYSSQRFE